MLVTTSGPTLIRHLQVILVRSLKIDKQRLNAHHGQLLRSHSEPAHNLPRLSDQYSFCRKYYEPLMQSEYPQQQMVSIEHRSHERQNQVDQPYLLLESLRCRLSQSVHSNQNSTEGHIGSQAL